MTNNLVSRAAVFAAGLLLSASAFAAGGGNLQHAGTDVGDKASLQRGAALYMNYCAGCHSLKYVRYARIGEDLGLSEEEVQGSLNFTGGKIGDHVISPMSAEMGVAAFGKAPPDLSVIARVRGSDWIFTYLKSFYLDESRPVGWNNTLFANASMPNPLWELQGLQQPVYGKRTAAGEMPVEGFTVSQPGTQDAAAFDQTVRDITAFLEYAGEPAATKREGLGVWVILFLAFFTMMAWLLKKEYWRDVH
ncbi:cytochrome c1 [Thermomonas sp.]|jgi:ubiquinol-cytochrome c reductase cytochrome c1 subunit|uniref:cytochrome c1 n=1 Tax=Thermomonas sp. TaxID=1971895 RepID=UPI001B4D71FD|nr:cytochrome c1 [Thermomonas sp.]MBK6416886.1 cytochrome c1 [Thermomonas sp.]MBK6924118.1 cytochrome c1 [Thermomonas sp.]MBK7204823.1 cytochrome c1 [Thermomonas sp.]MBL0227255.1 cytochrome c1 [Thermomonas sp.]MBP6437889.1 cytochrome c1 [Thermomonas sp.]